MLKILNTIDTQNLKKEIKQIEMHCLQRAVWRNGGSSPAEKAVQI